MKNKTIIHPNYNSDNFSEKFTAQIEWNNEEGVGLEWVRYNVSNNK